MIIGIDIPQGAKLVKTKDRILIIWDETKSKRDLWLARMEVWLTNGNKKEDFTGADALDIKGLTISCKKKMTLR